MSLRSAIAFVHAFGVFLLNDIVNGVANIWDYDPSCSREGGTANSPNAFVKLGAIQLFVIYDLLYRSTAP
jgi:hypothetical protein|tara:strand:+ start:2467 stop:2676 length:210 start_codon:yes stop_codon:yes gene_type:complete